MEAMQAHIESLLVASCGGSHRSGVSSGGAGKVGKRFFFLVHYSVLRSYFIAYVYIPLKRLFCILHDSLMWFLPFMCACVPMSVLCACIGR